MGEWNWYNLIYEIEELLKAQSFVEEHTLIRKKKFNPKQLIRLFLIIILVSVLMNALRVGPFINLLVYFTNWSLISTLLTCWLGYVIAGSRNLHIDNAINMHVLHHLFYTLSLFMNPVVFFMYWGVIHNEHMKEIRVKNEGNETLIEMKIWHAYIVHIVPIICNLVQMFINNSVLIRRHYMFLIYFSLLYLINNFVQVKLRGNDPVYWFLTWEDHQSFLICIFVIAVFVSLFLITALLDEWIT